MCRIIVATAAAAFTFRLSNRTENICGRTKINVFSSVSESGLMHTQENEQVF